MPAPSLTVRPWLVRLALWCVLLVAAGCQSDNPEAARSGASAPDTIAQAASPDTTEVATTGAPPANATTDAAPDAAPSEAAVETGSPPEREAGSGASPTDAPEKAEPRPQASSQEASSGESSSGESSSDETSGDTDLSDEDGRIQDTARSYGFRFAAAVLVFLLTFFTIKGAVFILEALAERSAERRLLYKRVIPIARILLWGIALVIVLRGIFNINAAGLLAAATAIGVAVGFAAQDLLKNIFGGLVIIFDQPFQAGDKISVGGTYGEVVAIGLRSTRIVTPDDNLVTVPNAQVVDGQVSNANAGALDCQVVTDLYLPGWVDERRAKNIAYEAAASSKYTYLQKPIAVIVKDEYDDGHVLHLKVKAYVLDTRYEFLLASDVTERARRVFRREGLLVPATRAFIDLPSRPDGGTPPEPNPPSTPAGDGSPPASNHSS